MSIIKKKCWPEWFEAILLGKKNYDLRLNDFEVNEGDFLLLEEWDPQTKSYTGRTIEKKITYLGKVLIDKSLWWSEEDIKKSGLQIMSLECKKPKAGVDYIGVGAGVMVLKDNKVLLGRRHPDPTLADSELRGEGTWTMPGGKIKYGESFEDCAKRELTQETSLIANDIKVICVQNDKNEYAHFVTIGFLTEDFSGEVKVMEPDEITEWQWFTLDNLPSPMYFPSASVLENYKAGTFYKK